MKKVAIIGRGRFGQVLFKLLRDDFSVSVFNSTNSKTENDLNKIYKNEVIFFAVPISAFESVIKSHKKYFKDSHLLIDVLAVKQYPEKIFRKYLNNTKIQAILTHPVFGPDSSREGFTDLPLVMNKFLANEKNFLFWKKYFISKGLKVVELTAKENDKLIANSLGISQFIGRLLGEFKFKQTLIDNLGSKRLRQVMDQACNDTWEMFDNLQNYNSYTKKMRLNFGRAFDKLYNQLLPRRINKKWIVYGIQGGKGSFNEEAIMEYVEKNKIRKYKIKYLYTSEKVLKNLYEGNIDYGLFAIENSIGGAVSESVQAMANYKFKIIKEFDFFVRHFLMKRKDVDFKNIKIVMAHSQNFLQCKNNLLRKYSNLEQVSGQGDMIDTARCAESLAKNTINKNTAILGPKILSEIYDLDIIDENLQDSPNNLTSFFLVSR